MKITQIIISMSRTVQLQPYESFQAKVSLTADMEPEDDPEVEYEILRRNVYKKIQEQIVRVLP